MPRQLDLTAPEPDANDRIIPTALHSEMQRSYLEYAMSVIVGRALPDVRDGLKPVHRRILYAMHELGLSPDRPYRKCARIVGDVLGKYHPHGDGAVYDALVRLVQDFSTRYPLIAGHGNFGSIDNDPPAAMRYTECRLAMVGSESLLSEVDEQTVEYTENFDGSQREPVVLPARLPILLLNGSSGIAVGMATNIPPHNLGELAESLIALIDNPDMSDEALMELLPGPDFPTGGRIVGKQGIRDAYLSGRGSITLRGVCNQEEVGSGRRRRPALVITELPFQVNKSAWIEKVAELVNAGKIVGISDIRDESSREGVRVVFEIKREARPDVILNALYRQTALQITFGVILLTIVQGQPRLLTLREILQQFIDFRVETLTRRTQFSLDKATERAHQLEGQMTALAHLAEIVPLLSAARDITQARVQLQERFPLSARQVDEILQMPLRRLTLLDRERLTSEHKELQEKIIELQSLLDSRRKLLNLMKREQRELKKKFSDPRRTLIESQAAPLPTTEQLTSDDPVLVQVTQKGYVRRYPLDERTSKAKRGRTEPGDPVVMNCTARTRYELLAITRSGRAYSLKIHEIPETGPRVRGTPLITLLAVSGDPLLTTFIQESYPQDRFLILLTRSGRIKKVALSECASLTGRGLMLLKLGEDDEVIAVAQATSKSQVVVASRTGRLLRFNADDAQLPVMGRTAVGLQALKAKKDEVLVGMAVVEADEQVLLTTSRGISKRLAVKELRLQERGGLGTPATMSTTKEPLVSMLFVGNGAEVVFLSDQEKLLRLSASAIALCGLRTPGNPLSGFAPAEQIVEVVAVAAEGESESVPD
ncbi:MAG: DNA gyrase subunit A [Anaerolineae bacterium]|nr:DNA gyrase subunit A [Gloeobacterales cyanobacterium ES-bin-313]